MYQSEKRILKFITESNFFTIILLLIGAYAGISVRLKGMHMVTDDYFTFLQPWYDTLKANTGFKGLALDFYNYYIPYMCILAIATYINDINLLQYIKIISIVSEFICAFLGGWICLKLSKENRTDASWFAVTLTVLLLSPTIVLNGAYWAQCDYIYIAFALASILFLLGDKYDLAFIFLGISFCFKQQIIFLFPAYLLYYICTKKFSALKFLYIPIIYLIAGLPAIIAGRPALDVYATYFRQAREADQLSYNIPNIWRFFPNFEYQDFSSWGIMLTVIIFCILAHIVFKNHYCLNHQTFLMICICSCGICVMFLPSMHERYIALYSLLFYLYSLIYDRKKVILAIVIDLITCITYFLYLYGLEHLAWYPLLAAVHIGILFYFICDTFSVLERIKSKI